MSRHGQQPILRPFLRIAPLGLVIVLLLSGCSVAGLLVGSVIDHSAGKGSVHRLIRVREGAEVTLWLRDGSKLHGRMVGFVSPPDTVRLRHGLPLTSETRILIRAGQQVLTIPTADVSRVSTPHFSWKLGLGLAGLGLDVATIVVAALAFTSTI